MLSVVQIGWVNSENSASGLMATQHMNPQTIPGEGRQVWGALLVGLWKATPVHIHLFTAEPQ